MRKNAHKWKSNLFALVLRALDIFATLALSFSPFCLSLAELLELEFDVRLRDPDEVDAVVGESVVAAGADDDDAEVTSNAVAVR